MARKEEGWTPTPIEEPNVEVIADGHRVGAERLTHRAFGQMMLFRSTGGGQALYGSDFEHNSCMTIELHESSVVRDSSRDWPSSGRLIAQVRMSAAQWATFVSSEGVGEGVQCTIVYADGEHRPRLPLRDADRLHYRELRKRLDDGMEEMRKAIAAVKASGLSAVKQGLILQPLLRAQMELTVNLDFVAESFGEAMEKRVEKAKLEIHAHMTDVLKRAGLKALREAEAPLVIEGGGDGN